MLIKIMLSVKSKRGIPPENSPLVHQMLADLKKVQKGQLTL